METNKNDVMMDLLCKNFSDNIREKLNFSWIDTRTPGLLHVTMATMAKVLKSHQTTRVPNVACVLKDLKGNFKFGMAMHYIKPEDESGDEAGNWVMDCALNEADLGEINEIYDNHSDEFTAFAEHMANSLMNGHFKTVEFMTSLMCELIDSIIFTLDAVDVANPDAVKTIEMKGIMTASVALEEGVKVLSITPGEVIKQMIKADEAN